MAEGLSDVEVATRTDYTVVQGACGSDTPPPGVAGLAERPRSERPPGITARKRAQVIALML